MPGESMDYEELDDFLFTQGFDSSFEALTGKIQGTSNDTVFEVLEMIGDLFVSNLQEIKGQLLQLFGICLLFCIIHQLSKAYGKESIEKYGYYIYFLCGATICLNLFAGGYETVFKTATVLVRFMEVLLPTYGIALMLSNGANTSGAYYGAVLLMLFLIEILVLTIFLPGTKLYMATRFVNQGVGENFFSKFLKLFEDGFSWGLKAILIGVCSINTIQGLIFPAVDRVRRLSVGKTVSLIPGVGTLAGSATELLLSSGSLLKNSMGIAAVLVLVALCAPALMKLISMIVGLRLLEACLEPVLGNKAGALMEGCYKSIQMLLKIQIHILTVFSLSLVIMTALS